ncbi:transcriptional regulator [Bdellovibrio bacteriovorus]|uniref:DNA-3-methyladenine glycosylase II n=1 Tax=Bdellovibrio bacteriovorus TaxID=959 RepID=A0A150WMR0_BDEBC|nr:Ada metal-binding domain-containing protein [Bdellovibrio bacteriovorus]KYG65752.1 transcriptional regulator [Bdellovibrio bacteriovorus]
MKQDDIFYQAMLARDPRFDGKFFVGVKTTGIYCRPICPAKPRRENVEFFSSPFEAERSGYRPCLRCRPESAPRSPAWIGTSAVVQRALKVLHAQESLDFNEDDFANQFGVTARHLRRLFIKEIGKTPKQLSFENRLNLSRKLISETSLPISEAALAAGFKSIRRFNAAFKDRFKKSPRDIRRSKISKTENLRLSLSYRPPFDFAGLLKTYKNHRMGHLEWFTDDTMFRVVHHNGQVGTVCIKDHADSSCLMVEIEFPDSSAVIFILSKIRAMFDLDSDPVIVANALEKDPDLKKILKKYPGIRLPSGWDGFEVAIASILGQLVSVERGRALVHDLIEMIGTDSGLTNELGPIKLFPTPKQIVDADLEKLKTTRTRKQTLKDFSKALIDGKISLEPTQDVDAFIKQVLKIRGIGPWTANYMALKVLRSTDTFPGTDLILARALDNHHPELLNRVRPWRGYAAALFWRGYTGTVAKKGK